MRKFFLFSLFVLVCVSGASAQVTTAQVNGTVVDSSNAAVPNATVTITNTQTKFSRSTRTTQTGNYVISFLPPGVYTLKVEAPNFASVVQDRIGLAIGQQATYRFTLKPGAANEVVTVTGEPALIETTRSEVGGTVSPVEVRELPIIDRNFASLTSLIPGVRPSPGFDPTKSRVGNTSVNGGDGRQFDVNVDGGDNKDNVVGGLVQNFTMEGIQEFNVITNRYSAEAGRTVGGVVNVISKSGTNSFHGTAFGMFQNDNLNRLDFFTRQNCIDQGIAEDDCENPEFKRFQFGGSLGGPIVKDRFFFFGAYENKRQPQQISVLEDAFTQLSLLQPPNFPLALTAPVRQLNNTYIDHLATVKLDHRVTDKQLMNYRYARQRWTNPNDQLGNPFTTDPSANNSNTNNFHDFTINHNYAISPTKVNSLTLHFQDMVNQILADPARTFTMPAENGTATNPLICFAAGCGGGGPELGTNINVPQATFIRKYQVRNDFSWTVNRHNLRIGGNYIFLPKLGGFFFFGGQGYAITFFDDPATIVSDTATYPQGFSTPNAVQSITFSTGDPNFNQRAHQLAFYFQDDFKVTPRLTLNLGLRWDANINFLPQQLGDTPQESNRGINILRQLLAANLPNTPDVQAGVARARLIAGDDDDLRRTTTSWKEFQPRIGFAWDPTGSGRIVVRGGYGIAFDQLFQNLTLFSLQQSKPGIFSTPLNLISGSRTSPDPTLANFRFGVDPLPASGQAEDDLPPGSIAFIVDPRARDPYAHQWSAGVGWQFHPEFALTVDYYHVLGLHEPRILNMNPQIAGGARLLDAAFIAAGLGADRLNEIRYTATNNRSRFDSLNFQIKKTMSRRFSFQTSYVLSWAQSWGGRPTASYGGTAQAIPPEFQFRENEFGPTTTDERHRWVFSGVFELPGGFQVSPIIQASSARPLASGASVAGGILAGTDIDGDGRRTLDRVCVGSTAQNPIVQPGCEQTEVNSFRGDPFFQIDLRTAKSFRFTETAALRVFWEFFNLTDRDNFCNNFSNTANAADYLEPRGYCGGQGFGPGFSGPLRSQFGFRFEF